MSEVLKEMKERRSIRKYKSEMVPQDVLDKIIEAGLYAASGKGTQNTIIIQVTKKELRDEIAEMNRKIGGWEEGFDPFYGAPTVCFIFVPKDESNGVKDGSLVIGAMQTGAYALSIGSCWINRCKEMFELPEGKKYLEKWHLEDYEGVGCCILGYIEKALPEKVILENRVIKG